MSDADDGLVPVRMVNELVFCARLFWLEEVAAAFEDNAHTVLGQHAHRAVDVPGGAVDHPGDEAPWQARALWVASSALGVSGKIDLVDDDPLEPGAVMPVDTKKGRAPVEGLWPSDEVQLVLAALLLREHGFVVSRVAAYYATERRRVVVALDDDRIARARAAVEEARRVRELREPPPPLVDSPKCGGCSLAQVCQPDEVVALGSGAGDEAAPLRRVQPANDELRHVVITSPRARLGIDRDVLVLVERDDDGDEVESRLGLDRLASVTVCGRAQVSTQAQHALFRRDIPIAWLSSGGYFLGLSMSAVSNRADIRVAQHALVRDGGGLDGARVLIADKIANTRTLLRRNREDGDDAVTDAELDRIARLVQMAERAPNAPALLAVEGEAAKRSWGAFSTLLTRTDARFAMAGRSRRPPRDATNAMLSFLYGMLTRDCMLACAMAGLDPFVGLFHTTHHNRPSLALDLMEPFRSLLVESTVLGLVRRGEVKPEGFVNTGVAVAMDKTTKKAVVTAYERRLMEHVTHPRFGYRIRYRQALLVHARLLARFFSGEIPAMPSFRTR